MKIEKSPNWITITINDNEEIHMGRYSGKATHYKNNKSVRSTKFEVRDDEFMIADAIRWVS